ncbi:MAG TPA: sulfurtransferase [Thermoleophilaceae bacterium]
MTTMSIGPLVSASWLREHARDSRVRVVDCRFTLTDPAAGERGYLEGHIPGAAFMDLNRHLAGPPGGPEGGRHPLPDPERFAESARRAGISRDSAVIAYDEQGEGGAARLWWLLRHHGHERVAVLDGALGAWTAAGGPLTAGTEVIAPGDFEPSPGPDGDTAEAVEIERRLGDGSLALVDARAAERFRGENEPIDPVAGHIPGARNVPFAELAPGGAMPAPDEIHARLPDSSELVAYCGSGVTACVLVLAADVAGRRARLYPGSWSEWSSRGLPAD